MPASSVAGVIAKIGAAEVALSFVVTLVVLAGVVAIIALGVRIGTRGLRRRG